MPGDEVCLNCKILEQNEKKVPIWSKMEGNDSLLPLIIKLDKYNAKHSILKEELPELTKYTTSVNVESNKKERWLFYWAANRSKDPSHIMSERDAYGSNTNHGILRTDQNGNAKLILNCPQPYKDDNSKLTYPRHVHYTFLTSDDTWNENINSLVVLCHIDYEMMNTINDTKSHLILCTVKGDDTIDNSVYIDYKELYDMNRTERKHYLLRFLKDSLEKYPKLNAKVQSKNLKLRDIPIVVFGQNREDKSSLRTSEYLIDSNIVNVIEYNGGIDDFKNNKNNVDDDMEKIEYMGETYYIHEGIDVTDDEYKLVGEWIPEEKRIKFYDEGKDVKKDVEKDVEKDVDKDVKKDVEKDVDKDVKKGGADTDMGEKYKDKIIVNKLDRDPKDDNLIDDTDNNSDISLDLEENDDIVDNKDDNKLDDLFDISDSDDNNDDNNDDSNDDSDDESKKINELDIHNNKIGGSDIHDNDTDDDMDDGKKNLSNIGIKTEKINVLNSKYNNRGITFF